MALGVALGVALSMALGVRVVHQWPAMMTEAMTDMKASNA